MRPGAEHFSRLASGRSRVRLPDPRRRCGAMITLGRTPREVYRIYSEDEFLAGGDLLTDWRGSVAEGVSRAARWRRLAGLVALTGAVGSVASVIALVGFRARSSERQLAARGTPRGSVILSRTVPPAPRRVVGGEDSGHRDPPQPRRAAIARSAGGARSADRRPAAGARAVRPPTASALSIARAADMARPSARAEFGFER